MAKRTQAGSTSGGQGLREGRSRSLGRAIATGLVAFGLIYLIGCGLVSVLPQIFSPPRADIDPSVTCEVGLRDLRSELLAMAGERVAAGGHVATPAGPWLSDWDRRHVALETRCSDRGGDAWGLLARLRERVESTLQRYDGAEGALDRELSLALATPSSD